MSETLAFALFDGQPEWADITLALGVAFLVSAVIAWLLGRLVGVVLTAAFGS